MALAAKPASPTPLALCGAPPRFSTHELHDVTHRTPDIFCFEGGNALSDFRAPALLAKIQAVVPRVSAMIGAMKLRPQK